MQAIEHSDGDVYYHDIVLVGTSSGVMTTRGVHGWPKYFVYKDRVETYDPNEAFFLITYHPIEPEGHSNGN